MIKTNNTSSQETDRLPQSSGNFSQSRTAVRTQDEIPLYSPTADQKISQEDRTFLEDKMKRLDTKSPDDNNPTNQSKQNNNNNVVVNRVSFDSPNINQQANRVSLDYSNANRSNRRIIRNSLDMVPQPSVIVDDDNNTFARNQHRLSMANLQRMDSMQVKMGRTESQNISYQIYDKIKGFFASELSAEVTKNKRTPYEIDPGDITFGPCISQGYNSDVYVGKYFHTFVAIKQYKNSQTNDYQTEYNKFYDFAMELFILGSLRHENLILLMGFFSKPCLSLVVEFANNGDLYTQLRQYRKYQLSQQQNPDQPFANDFDDDETTNFPYPTLKAAGILASVARGMEYLHNRPMEILHLDLKSPNVLINEHGVVKVADFGLSRVRQLNKKRGPQGTYQWMAPEQFSGGIETQATDVYSFGVIVWELLTSRIPWEGKSEFQVAYRMTEEKRGLEKPTQGDPYLIHLFQRCSQMDPDDRPTFNQIIQEMEVYFGLENLETQPLADYYKKSNWVRDSFNITSQMTRPQLLEVVYDSENHNSNTNSKASTLTKFHEGLNKTNSGSKQSKQYVQSGDSKQQVQSEAQTNSPLSYQANNRMSPSNTAEMAPDISMQSQDKGYKSARTRSEKSQQQFNNYVDEAMQQLPSIGNIQVAKKAKVGSQRNLAGEVQQQSPQSIAQKEGELVDNSGQFEYQVPKVPISPFGQSQKNGPSPFSNWQKQANQSASMSVEVNTTVPNQHMVSFREEDLINKGLYSRDNSYRSNYNNLDQKSENASLRISTSKLFTGEFPTTPFSQSSQKIRLSTPFKSQEKLNSTKFDDFGRCSSQGKSQILATGSTNKLNTGEFPTTPFSQNSKSIKMNTPFQSQSKLENVQVELDEEVITQDNITQDKTQDMLDVTNTSTLDAQEAQYRPPIFQSFFTSPFGAQNQSTVTQQMSTDKLEAVSNEQEQQQNTVKQNNNNSKNYLRDISFRIKKSFKDITLNPDQEFEGTEQQEKKLLKTTSSLPDVHQAQQVANNTFQQVQYLDFAQKRLHDLRQQTEQQEKLLSLNRKMIERLEAGINVMEKDFEKKMDGYNTYVPTSNSLVENLSVKYPEILKYPSTVNLSTVEQTKRNTTTQLPEMQSTPTPQRSYIPNPFRLSRLKSLRQHFQFSDTKESIQKDMQNNSLNKQQTDSFNYLQNQTTSSEEFLPSYLKLSVISLSRSKSEGFIPINLFGRNSVDEGQYESVTLDSGGKGNNTQGRFSQNLQGDSLRFIQQDEIDMSISNENGNKIFQQPRSAFFMSPFAQKA